MFVCLFVSADADDISLGSDEKQLIVVLLPDDEREERALLEQGLCVNATQQNLQLSIVQ